MNNCSPIDFVDIDWQSFNKELDRISPTPHFHLDYADPDSVLKDIPKYYNANNSTYYDYILPSFVDLFSQNFFIKHNIDQKHAFIKVLEHRPGSFTIPHKDYYTSLKKEKSLEEGTKIKRLWIPCTDHKFGHALFMGDKVIYN